MDEQEVLRSPITIFYSYVRADEKLRNQLEKHLSLLRQEGIVAEWHDRQILPGTDWLHEIDLHLSTAAVILLLISPDFLASDYCYSIEMQHALARHEAGEAHIIPIILRPVDWKQASFAKLQSLPSGGKPVTTWRSRDEAFRNVAEGIRRVIEHLQIAPGSPFREREGKVHNNAVAPTMLKIWPEQRASETDQQALQMATEDLSANLLLTENSDVTLWNKYRAKLYGDPDIARLQILGMGRSLAVTDVYIMVRLHEETRLSYRLDMEKQQETRDPLLLADLQQRYLEQRVGTAEDPVEALCRPRDPGQRRFVIVGNPGAGKTTLLKRLAMLAVDNKLPDTPCLPIYIRLNEFANASTSDLLRFILDTWQDRYGLQETESGPWLVGYLERGEVLVLLDALDETAVGQSVEAAEESYLRVSRKIMNFSTRFEKALIAVSSRKAGYHARTKLAGFSELEVLDFRLEEIAQFVHKWFQHYTPPTKHRLADQLLRELEQRVHIQSLAANPRRNISPHNC